MSLTRFSMLCELLETRLKSSKFNEILQNPVEQIFELTLQQKVLGDQGELEPNR